MRTDIRLFTLDRFGLPAESTRQSASCPRRWLYARRATWRRSGRASTAARVSARLDAKWAKQGVLFGSLDRTGRRARRSDLRPLLRARAVDPRNDKFAALHAACWSGGTLLYVPTRRARSTSRCTRSRRCPPAASISATRWSFWTTAPRRRCCAETASAAADAGGLHCGAIELIVGPGARLRYVNLQNWGHGVWHFAHQKALVDRDAALQWTIGALGSRLAKVNQHVALVGAGRRGPGQRRDVHRRQAAPLVPHAAAPPGPALQERLALQGGPAGPLADRLARHDQGRSRTPRRPTATSATTT